MRRLLEAISILQQLRLAEGLAKELNPDWYTDRRASVAAENPAGTVIAGNPVIEARMPSRSA